MAIEGTNLIFLQYMISLPLLNEERRTRDPHPPRLRKQRRRNDQRRMLMKA
jgi:hypothetical protein